ncbi:MAG: hypothetical protein RIQ62_322 [Bacteroidota bacterium]|jgi:hypothetical protein
MKKLLSFLLLVGSVSVAQAQYWQLPCIGIGQNPGGLNTDVEEPLAGVTGWTSIQATSATPVWSAVQTLPFAFQFNGSPVTQFKASTSGVVTFSTGTALAAPASAAAALPSASIPDNSICVWGLALSGTNDNIVIKTFGTAPNRQFWIQFSSASYPANAAIFTYWAVVLDETTNKIHIVDQRVGASSGSNVLALSAGIQINATTALTVAGSPALASTTAATGGSSDTYADNSYWTFTPGTQPAKDATVLNMTPSKLTNASFALVGSTVPVQVKIQNLGSTTMTAYNVKINDGATTTNYPQTTTLTTGAIATVPISYTMPSVGSKPIKLWVELAGDVNTANDSAKSEFNGASYTPVHTSVFEEATGTWCQWCPRGAVYMDSLTSVHPEVVAIAVHNGDPMTVTDYDAGIGNYISGYPSGLVDRKVVADPSDFFTEYTNHKSDFGVGDITINQPTVSGNNVSVKVDVKMAISTQAAYDYRLAMVFTEDEMHGTTSTWNQANAYAGGANGVMGGFELLPSTVPAAQMYYNHVARVIVGGFTGQTGSLPGVMTAGSTYSYTFNWTAPAGTVLYKTKANALLICGLSGEIHNGKWMGVYPTSVNDIIKVDDLQVFPNPTNDYLNIDFTLNKVSDVAVSLVDMTGNVVYNNPLKNLNGNQGLVINTANFANGMYTLSLRTAEGNITRKVSIAH